MSEALDNPVFVLMIGAIIVFGCGALAIAEIRDCIRIERRCRQLMDEARELGEEVDE